MGRVYWKAFVVIQVFCVGSLAAVDNNELLDRLDATEELVKALANRVDLLESREKIHLDRIANLEARDHHQQETIDELKQQLEKQLALAESDDDAEQHGNNTRPHEEPNNESYSVRKGIDRIRTVSTIKERSISSIRQAQFESPVAFYVQLHSDFTHAGTNQVFVFQDEITNIGNAYNTVSGMFTAPGEGIYVFSTTLVSSYHVNAHASFYRNNDKVNVMYVSGVEAGHDTTSATIVLHLQKGDIISVHNGDSDDSYVGSKHSSFSGFLLSAYDIPAVIDNNELLDRLDATEELVKALAHRVDLLESRERIHLDRIVNLEARDNQQQETIDELQRQLEKQRPLAGSDDYVKQHKDKNFTQEEPKSELCSESTGIDRTRTLSAIKGRSIHITRQAQLESPVAFYVHLHSNLLHAGINQVFIFQDEITNIGNAYNTVLGMFTAPVEGIYVFSTTLFSDYHVNAHASFYRNNDKINMMYVSGAEAGYDTTSATIVLHLQKGDMITVRNGDSDVTYVGQKYSSFSGFLLTDYGSPAVIGK